MSRPEDIPEDVWKTACACVSAPDRLGYAKAYTDLIARAILAAKLEEREACAVLCDEELRSREALSRGVRPTSAGSLGELCLSIGGAASAKMLAQAIRSRP